MKKKLLLIPPIILLMATAFCAIPWGNKKCNPPTFSKIYGRHYFDQDTVVAVDRGFKPSLYSDQHVFSINYLVTPEALAAEAKFFGVTAETLSELQLKLLGLYDSGMVTILQVGEDGAEKWLEVTVIREHLFPCSPPPSGLAFPLWGRLPLGRILPNGRTLPPIYALPAIAVVLIFAVSVSLINSRRKNALGGA